MTQPDPVTEWVQQLDEVLRRRDVGRLRAFISAHAHEDPAYPVLLSRPDPMLELTMWTTILSRRDLADLHDEARRNRLRILGAT